jgi:pimeloyl-ACP methyl ester carboxylesterase
LSWENLRDIVLVGHSYGGGVARHVADRMPDRIRSLIYLDAFVPENGKTLFDYLPDNGEGDRKLAVATRCPALKRRRKSAAPATTSQKSDTFWRVALKVLSASFTSRQESAAGGRRSLHAGMM